jgi:hypothetical protein
VLKFKAITGKKELPPDLMRQLKEGTDRVKALEGQLAAKTAENEALRSRGPAGASRKRVSPEQKRTLDSDFDALTKRAAELMRPVKSEAMFARVEDPELASVIRKMAKNRSDAGEDAVSSIAKATGLPREDVADTIAAERRDEQRGRAIDKQRAEVRRRINERDFGQPPKRERPVYGPEIAKLQELLAREKNKLQQLAAKHERLNDTRLGKTLRAIHDMRLFSILSSIAVYGKLAAAVVTRNSSQLAEEALGSVLRHVPGVSGIAAYSPRYHGRDFWRGMGAFGKGLGSAFKRSLEDLKMGQNKWDVQFGAKHLSPEYTQFMSGLADAIKTPGAGGKITETMHALAHTVASTHAAIKEFVSEPEMNVAALKIGAQMRRQLLAKGMSPDAIEDHMAKESVQTSILAQAYTHSLESKFQGRNFITDSVNNMLIRWEKAGGPLGKLASFAFKTEFPIRGIPMNIAKEALTSYPFGFFKALPHMLSFKGLKESEKPAAADYIMKNLRKQGVGIATIALGAMFQQFFGGVPGAEKHKGTIKPGEAELPGMFATGTTKFGTGAMHGPIPELLQLGASMMRVYEKEYGAHGFDAAISALAQVYPVQAGELVPYWDEPMNWQPLTAERARREGRPPAGALLGEMIRSGTVPAFVQQQAAGRAGVLQIPALADPYKGYRKPKNIAQDIELGIPGLRETVPQ